MAGIYGKRFANFMTGVPRWIGQYPLEKNTPGSVTCARMNPWLRTVTPVLAFTFAAAAAAAKPKNDFTRMTPAPADQPIPVADFFRPSLFRNPEINPGGTHFAALMATKPDQTDLVIFDLNSKKIERLGGGPEKDITGYQWQNDRQLTFKLSGHLYIAELGKLSQAAAIDGLSVLIPLATSKTDPTHMLAWMPRKLPAPIGSVGIVSMGGLPMSSMTSVSEDGGVMKIDLAKRSIYAGKAEGVFAEIIERYPIPPEGAATGYHADAEGNLAFSVTQVKGKRRLYRFENRTWTLCPIELEKTRFAGFGRTRGEILVYSAKERGKPAALCRLDVITGELGEVVYQDTKYDAIAARFYRHPVTKALLGLQYYRSGLETVWFDPAYRELQATLDASFPKEIVRVLGSDREEKQFLIEVSSDVRPSTYYHFNRQTAEAVPLANAAPWLDPKRMQPMRTLTYKARDGREIEGFVTLPAGASKQKPAPLVVLPHGGPWVRDSWGWRPTTQFLASRGYAVFQPNYRGSPGYGWRFPDQEERDFVKMHHDVTDGVKAVLKTGMVDPQRIAIMGASFGGYLALQGATDEGDLYRCAISMAGVFDWEMIIKDARDRDQFVKYDRLIQKVGDPSADEEKFLAMSPINRVQQIKIPVFVAHGMEDRVSTVDQSQALIRELKKYSVPHETMLRKGEAHGFHKHENRVEYYTAIEAFLAKHLAPKPAVVAIHEAKMLTER
jgi:acetyl esterase/lipase